MEFFDIPFSGILDPSSSPSADPAQRDERRASALRFLESYRRMPFEPGEPPAGDVAPFLKAFARDLRLLWPDRDLPEDAAWFVARYDAGA